MSESRERDLVLAPNEYAFISDQTKGNINVYVGPYKTSLANTDKPVVFNENSKRFEICSLEQSTQTFCTAPEGWYIVLKNPAFDNKQPKTGTTNSLAELLIGRKVNIPGPTFFALWPGQMAKVVMGHHMRSNQYVVVRVYDEDEAQKNWANSVMKTKDGEDVNIEEKPDLTIGNHLIIKGTHVSFYIPPTGMEVVRDSKGNYVREAVTLERMEYCILLDENGNKRYLRGPAVVFPEPTEEFIEENGFRKFRAIELNEVTGLYIKVIAPYEENGKTYKEGDELFFSGQEQAIYYPRPEHALIKYGNQVYYNSVAIPKGEGRYFLNRKTGEISLKRGPCMFLPDPREEIIVRRILDPKKVQLWFPGNVEALEYNKLLKEISNEETEHFVQEQQVLNLNKAILPVTEKLKKEAPGESLVRDSFERKYVPPRSITLDTKYEGAVNVNVWNGYAVQIVSKTGDRKVLVGPISYLLEYDEDLQTIEFSTGTPKNDQNLMRTVYLRTLNNKISDVVTVESSDFCEVHIHLAFRLNFTGESEKWFNVENYVKFLTEHVRSLLRNVLKKHKVMDLYANAVGLVRDSILGKSEEGQKRPGKLFEENGMHVYDVEVMDIKLGDANIEQMLVNAQQDVMRMELTLAAEKRRLEFTKEKEEIQRQINETTAETTRKSLDLQKLEVEKVKELNLSKINSEHEGKLQHLIGELARMEHQKSLLAGEILNMESKHALDNKIAQDKLNQKIQEIKTEVDAVVAKAEAVSPEFIAALQAFGDKALAEKMAESMAPLAILGGKSVAEVLNQLLKGTKLENIISLPE